MTDNELDNSKSTDKAYRDGQTLRDLYHGEEMTIPEIADYFGVADSTIHRWIERNNIDTRVRGTGKLPYVSLDMDGQGYERWKDRDGGDHTTVRVHQLLAIACGESPCDIFGSGNHVHHLNGIPWDNRAENIEIVSASEHGSVHFTGSRNSQSKLTEEQVKEIKERLRAGESCPSISESYPVNAQRIREISSGLGWNHVR